MDKNNLNGEPWWKQGIRLFSQVSGWVVVPIILALIVGKALDNYFNTKPFIFLGLTGIAFLFSIFGIVRVVSKYMKEIEKDGNK